MEEKVSELGKLYLDFSEKAGAWKLEQACNKGCGFCCTNAGSIDITTLEGLNIKKAVKALPRARQQSLAKEIHRDIRLREKGKVNACPFFQKNKACMIYEARPFSCRRIYSNHVCTSEKPPEVHREVMALADRTIKALQQVDSTGYSGHISYVLHMLDSPAFMDTYLNGKFKPEEIMAFGKSHKIVINNMMI